MSSRTGDVTAPPTPCLKASVSLQEEEEEEQHEEEEEEDEDADECAEDDAAAEGW